MITDFESGIGVVFRDRDLLREALTHSSYTMEHDLPRSVCNERLEFLGDAFFDAIIGEELYRRRPDDEEGELTKLRALIVCEDSLYQVGLSLGIGQLLYLGNGQLAGGGRERPSILADAMEAVIGAVYLDQGYDTARDMVLRLFAHRIDDALSGRIVADYKSAFQEERQKEGITDIHYVVEREAGPDHDKTFYVNLLVGGSVAGRGVGKSKKHAEQAAARDALQKEKHVL